ncbi:MAG: hypothetical protein L7V87_12555 [Verrucomicrobiales bacterium]|jgi:hypothetical protein|nr:hypothetical protein [Verrucomicrobiales bacterium]
MEFLRFFPVLTAIAFFFTPAVNAQELTPEQIESLRAKLKSLKADLESHLSSRNSGAGSVFSSAAEDPRAAVDLYLNCEKLVNYEREGRPESDFRAWKESNEDQLRDAGFIESLQMQLRYLALSCQAAEAKEIDQVFTPLMSYVDSLSRLEEMPTGNLTSSVAGSVFAEAYNLQRLLGENDAWEDTPFNISGIYESTILPYLREEKPDTLMNAWNKRIEQETRLVQMLEAHKEKELRGMSRDRQARARGQQNRGDGVLRRLDNDDFIRETLPRMEWAKLRDMYEYVNQLEGAKAMLSFIEEHLQHDLGEEFFQAFEAVIGASNAPNPLTPAGNGEATPSN